MDTISPVFFFLDRIVSKMNASFIWCDSSKVNASANRLRWKGKNKRFYAVVECTVECSSHSSLRIFQLTSLILLWITIITKPERSLSKLINAFGFTGNFVKKIIINLAIDKHKQIILCHYLVWTRSEKKKQKKKHFVTKSTIATKTTWKSFNVKTSLVYIRKYEFFLKNSILILFLAFSIYGLI